MNKKFKIGFFVVTAILVGAVIYLSIELYKKEPKLNNKIDNENISQTNTVKSNNIKNNLIENTAQENIIGNNVISNNINAVDNTSEVVEDSKMDETKAINIVKQNWGEDNTVYFSYDGQSNTGKYIISVRDRSTTKTLNYYEVDALTGDFDIR